MSHPVSLHTHIKNKILHCNIGHSFSLRVIKKNTPQHRFLEENGFITESKAVPKIILYAHFCAVVPSYDSNLTHILPCGVKTKQQLELENKGLLGIISDLHRNPCIHPT